VTTDRPSHGLSFPAGYPALFYDFLVHTSFLHAIIHRAWCLGGRPDIGKPKHPLKKLTCPEFPIEVGDDVYGGGMRQAGILATAGDPIRFVTHLDVNQQDVDRLLDAIRRFFSAELCRRCVRAL